MPNVASIYKCGSGLVLLSRAEIDKMCKGCYFTTHFSYPDCRRESDPYYQSLPSCEHRDVSLIYIKLEDK